MVRSDKIKFWGSKITKLLLRHSSGFWLMVLGILGKTLVTQGVPALIRHGYFPDTSRKIYCLNQPGLLTCCNIWLSVKLCGHADAFVPNKSAQASIG
jgi:hypothetical protein